MAKIKTTRTIETDGYDLTVGDLLALIADSDNSTKINITASIAYGNDPREHDVFYIEVVE